MLVVRFCSVCIMSERYDLFLEFDRILIRTIHVNRLIVNYFLLEILPSLSQLSEIDISLKYHFVQS